MCVFVCVCAHSWDQMISSYIRRCAPPVSIVVVADVVSLASTCDVGCVAQLVILPLTMHMYITTHSIVVWIMRLVEMSPMWYSAVKGTWAPTIEHQIGLLPTRNVLSCNNRMRLAGWQRARSIRVGEVDGLRKRWSVWDNVFPRV